ncbi:DNA-3-methyladenine glycosylase I [Streptococcus cuniculipharyngis]|uniref:DNA-3-methyladenine glycosylase I n=1 Tax=Streptococcus cuniculipharyngis TaxID=1562651 RepID=A0A5C5S9K8_9STRE|nr:DNA-3-methyladenine glycosylase I [Streptococcus cuniculipharyngis]TWS97135.1 DNA-3-methyladenine glycosylase I [Streptococcus cuniculipharyngis]
MTRCSWVPEDNALYCQYHDEEWGRPLTDDQALFELLCLESYQSGLSWLTVLKKRPAFRQAFYNYDIGRVAQMTAADLEKLLQNPALIRHRLKLAATINNAKAMQVLQEEEGSFSHYLWGFVNHHPLDNQVSDYKQVPNQTVLSQALAKDLKKRGFKFLGPVTLYSFMQAAGLVNDHELSCDYHF